MSSGRIQRDGGGVGHVQRPNRTGHVEARECGDRIASLLAQSLTFRAQNQRDSLGGKRLFELGRTFRIEPDGLEADVVQLAKRVGKVAYLDMIYVLQCARCGFGKHSRFGRAVAGRGDQRARAECDRRAHYRTDIVRISHLIQHQNQLRVSQSRKRFGLQRMSFEKRTLMNRFAADDPVDVARFDHFEGEGQLGTLFKLETSQSIARNHKTLDAASWIIERSADRVQAIQPHKPIYRRITCYDAWPRSA